jgi:hypothetical protein
MDAARWRVFGVPTRNNCLTRCSHKPTGSGTPRGAGVADTVGMNRAYRNHDGWRAQLDESAFAGTVASDRFYALPGCPGASTATKPPLPRLAIDESGYGQLMRETQASGSNPPLL